MKRLILAFILFLLLLPAAGMAAGIEGVYACNGTNPGGGGSYQGTLAIIQNGDAYNVTWNIGAQTYVGVGLLQGDSFSVGYSDVKKSWFGVVVYKVSGNTLKGIWTMQGGSKTGTETLTKK